MFDEARLRAARLPLWSAPVEPLPLHGGITNRNFLVEDEGRSFVVRIGGDIDVHGIVRTNELAASRAAALAGVAPAVVYAEPGALVLDYVEGRSLTAEDVRDAGNLGRIVSILRRCHQDVPKYLRGPGILFWPFHVVRDYAHRLENDPRANRETVKTLLLHSTGLERAVGPVKLVFGHNDLLAANILDDGKRLWLIDWDYAGFNSALFDLGGLASNNELSPTQRETLLETYFEAPVTDQLRRRFAAMTAVSLLRETLWSMVSELHSSIDFDYAAYTAENLGRYERAFAAFQATAG